MANDVTAYLRAQDSGFTSTLSKASSMMGKFSGSSEKSGKSFLASAKSVMVGVGLYKVARTALSAVTNSISNAMGRQDTMDAFSRTITTLTGDSGAAARALEDLKGATKGTAYGLDVAAKATQNFVTRGMDLKAATNSVEAWADAVAFYGKGTNEELATVTDAIAKMRTKGKVDMNQLNRMFDVGIDAVGMYATANSQSSEEVQTALSNGSLSAEQFLNTVENGMMTGADGIRKVAGAAKEAGASWEGSIANMKSAITRGTLAMINSLDSVTESLTGSSIKEWIATVGTLFENNLKRVGDALQLAVNFINPYKEAMQSAFVGVGGEVKEAILSVVQSLQGMYSTFDGTSSVNTFKDIMVVVAEKIQQASIWIQQNSDEIAKWIVWIGKAALAFKGLQIATGILQPLVGLAANASNGFVSLSNSLALANTNTSAMLSNVGTRLSSLGGSFKTFGGTVVSTFTSMRGDGFNVLTSGLQGMRTSILNTSPALMQFSQNLTMTKLNMMRVGEGNAFTRPFLALSSTLQMTNPKLAGFTNGIRSMGNSVLHPIQSLTALKASLIATSVAAGGSGKAMSGMGIKVGQAFKTMGTTVVTAIKGVTTAMLTNPITAILVAITLAVAGMALAWKSNFMNIQGVVKSFGSGIVRSITSLKSVFKGLDGVIKPMGDALKVVGVILGGMFGLAIAIVVDIFRALVTAVANVIRYFKILITVSKAAGKALKGDFKGAGKEMEKVKDDVAAIGQSYVDLAKNSATGELIKATGEFGKKVDDVKGKSNEMAGKVTADFGAISKVAQETASAFEESKSKMDEAFNYEGQNEINLNYFETAKVSMDSFIKAQEETNEAYQTALDEIEQIDEKNINQRVGAIAKANSEKMASVSANNAGLIALDTDYSKMLAENQDASGEALTDQQRTFLQEQTAMIREQLILQNEAYMQAAQEKLNQGVALSETEKSAALSTMNTLYQQKKEVIATNEEQIAQQNEILQNAQTENEETVARQKIADLETTNKQILVDQAGYGQNMLSLLTDQGEVNSETVGVGLQKMGDISNDKLAEILRAFQLNNGSISETLTVLTGVMQTKGVEGASSLKQAFETGDFNGLMSNVSQGMIDGISALPPEMFKNGNDGKQQFINALQSGQTDSKALGAMLSSEVTKGVDSGKSGLSGSSKEFAKLFPTSLDAEKSTITKIVKETADYLPKELKKSEKEVEKNAKSNGNTVASGLESTNANVTTKSKDLMNGSVSAMKTVDFKPVGSYITGGVADGMDGTAAINKAQTIVDQVKKKMKEAADIHSPSRLFRDEIGKNISLGLAVGIEEYGREAVNTAQNLMDTLYSVSTSTGFGGIIPDNGKLEVTTSDSFISRLEQTFEKFIETHQYIMLDNGALIGETAQGYNAALGGIIGKEKRDRW